MEGCVRTVLMAANQYLTNNSNSNLVYLQSQLKSLENNLTNPVSLKFFHSKDILAIDCLTCLVQFISDPQVKIPVAHHCFMVFNNLVKDNEVCEVLQKNFHLGEILAGVLRNLLDRQSDDIIVECLPLLLTLTYGQTINFHDNNIQFLLSYLISNICDSPSELTQSCLGLLANLCRNNITVQKYIRDSANKKLYRTLLSFLSDKNKTIIIFSISVIFNVFQHEDLGEKVLSGKNLINVLQLLFNILFNGDTGLTLKYTVDVFRDIIKNQKIVRILISYQDLPMCLEKTLNRLKSSVPECVSKMYELLIDLCTVSPIRSTICQLMLQCTPITNTQQLDQLLQRPVNQIPSPLYATIHWTSQSTNKTNTHITSLLAIDFLKEVFEEVLYSDKKPEGYSKHTEIVVYLLLQLLHTNSQFTSSSTDIKKHVEKITKVLQFLTVLCNDDDVKKTISSQISIQLFSTILDFQLNHNKHIYMNQMAEKKHSDWSESGMCVVLLCLNLMSILRRSVNDLDKCFATYLQDSKLVPLLASYLTSNNKEHVQMALQLVTTAAKLDIYLDVVLCDSIAAINSNKTVMPVNGEFCEKPAGLDPPSSSLILQRRVLDKENLQPISNGVKSSPQSDPSIQNLVSKMESSLEMKDHKMSDIIQLYEHQLQSLKVNEEHLENLLKAKSLELVQSDRLISQYRITGARYEADSQNLRSMLHESEKKSESLVEKVNEMRINNNHLEEQVEQLEQENHKFSSILDEYEELKSNYSELVDREDKVRRSLTTVKQEMKAKEEMYDMLQKYHTDLKEQNDKTCDQLYTLEKEWKQLEKAMKEKETKLQELTKSFNKLETKYTSIAKEKEDLETHREEQETVIDQLQSELSKLSNTKKELQTKVSSLEKVFQEHEAAIQEKDQIIEEQEEQISKHAQIAALIQSSCAPTTRGKKK